MSRVLQRRARIVRCSGGRIEVNVDGHESETRTTIIIGNSHLDLKNSFACIRMI